MATGMTHSIKCMGSCASLGDDGILRKSRLQIIVSCLLVDILVIVLIVEKTSKGSL